MNRLRAWITHQNEALDVETIDVFLPDLPPVLEGFRIAVVSDLHMANLRGYHHFILDAVLSARPECILIAGDTIDANTGGIAELAPFFQALSRAAPTIAVLGNNDCLPSRIDMLRRMYQTSGVTLLENETRLLPARGLPLQITGMLDPEAQRRDIQPHRPQRQEADAYVPVSSVLTPRETEQSRLPSLLLLHQPQLATHYAGLRPSLIIAGHAHGGQFRVPGIGGLYAPDQGILPKWTSGLYPLGESQLVVSRGLGNHILPLRLNNPPHIPVLYLRKK